jgi:hypothetical protein
MFFRKLSMLWEFKLTEILFESIIFPIKSIIK